MDYYLVDLENVGNKGLEGADLLNENSRIVVFYSAAAGKISEFCCDLLMQGKAGVDWQPVNARTKNALDFELAVYTGGLLRDTDTGSIYIISVDNGYKAVLEAGNKTKPGTIFQYSSILEAWYMRKRETDDSFGEMASIKSVRKMLRQKKLIESIAARTELDSGAVINLIAECGTDIHRLYLGMLHAFGKEKGLAVYRQIRGNNLGPFSRGQKNEETSG